MHRLFGAISMLALLCASANAATLTATDGASLVAQAQAAQPGDVVEMQPGAWGDVTLQGIVKAAPGITIRPPAGTTIQVTSLDTQFSSYLTIDNLEVLFSGGSTAQPVQLSNDSHITVNGLKIHQASAAVAGGFGAYIRNASYVTVNASEIFYAGIAVASIDSDHTTISNTSIHDVTDDIMDLDGSPFVTVTGNTATAGNFSGFHPDFIQFDVGQVNKDNCGADIEANRYDRGTSATQANGIFGISVCNAVVKGNVLRGANANGIYLGGSHDVAISGNFVQGYPDMGSSIVVSADDVNVSVTGNAANGYAVAGAAVTPGAGADPSNSVIPQAANGAEALLTAWQGASLAVPGPSAAAPAPADPDPLQATVTAQAAQIATLQAQAATNATALTAANAKAATLQAKITAATKALQAKTANTVKAVQTVIAGALAALK